jgi:hypothetical protein
MSLPPFLDGLSEIRGALSADPAGKLTAASGRDAGERDAVASAAAAAQLGAAGAAMGLARLELFVVKGATRSAVIAVRPDELLLAAVDPARGTAQVEKALLAWAANEAPPPVPARPAEAPARRTPPPRAATTPVPVPIAPRPGAAGTPQAKSENPWSALRHALIRGQLTEAASRRRALAGPAAGPVRPGAEPLAPGELDGAMQTLLQGIGSVLAGDGVGGARTLEPLATTAQNLSFRWLALFWSGRAALKSGNSAAARTRLTEALLIAKQLDADAVACSQWIAAEILAHDGDHKRALACLAAARAAFEKLGERWGLGQTWLAEARVQAAQQREEDAASAARQAWATDAAWEEPAVFLARRALVRGELAEAEGLLKFVVGPAAERVRAIIEALRQKAVTEADAAEYLRESDAPPTARSIKAMERIAQAAPRFVQARESLAWMLLKVGKYPEASALFRGLLGQQLSQSDRASVMLGLGCIAHAQQTGKDSDTRLQAVLAGATAPGPAAASDVGPLPAVSSTSLPARSSQVSASAVFSGQLSVFALPDVIEFVRSARRTGVLVLGSEKGMAAVQFRDGRIAGATSSSAPDLCELLLQGKKITNLALRAVKTAHPVDQPDHVVAAQLVKDGVVDEPTVRETLRRKIELIVLEVLKWKDGEFAFNRDGEGGPGAPSGVEFDAQDVLLNVLKQIDEDARGRAAPAAR